MNFYIYKINLNNGKKWGLGIGDWGLGIGDWGLGPIPNPQSPIPNPHKYVLNYSINNSYKLILIINKNLQK